jgi:hypothetical protein
MEYVAKRPVYMPTHDLLLLELHLMETRPGVQLEAFIEEFLKRWLEIDIEKLELRKNGQPTHGFQWKNVFLPEGTQLRTSYGQITAFAKVVGEFILTEDGTSLTPSTFANRYTRGRNAWRFVWLRFPGENCWTRAENCRQNTLSTSKHAHASGQLHASALTRTKKQNSTP